MNKNGLMLVEYVIVVAIVGLFAAMFVPLVVHPRELKNPGLSNEQLLQKYHFEKLFEVKGYDVYTFQDVYNHYYAITIPSTTNSLPDLERR